MKKAIVILIVMSLGAIGLMAEGLDELPAYIVCHDSWGATYYCTLMSTTIFGQAIYSIAVDPYAGQGLLFVNLTYGNFHIIVFANGSWLAYAQVGTINKPCTTAYNANELGGLAEITICLGPSTIDGRETNPNLKK